MENPNRTCQSLRERYKACDVEGLRFTIRYQRRFIQVTVELVIEEQKYLEDSLKRPKYMVSDLLIQSRGYEGNLLAVELKKKGSIKKAISKDRERLKSLVTPGSLSQLTGCVHDTLLGAFIIYSMDGVDMDIFEFSSKEGNVIPRKYSLRCLFREYDETKINAIEINDGTQSWLIDPKVPHKK